jgi:hypothetical protein
VQTPTPIAIIKPGPKSASTLTGALDEQKAKAQNSSPVDEGRKRVLVIIAGVLVVT